MHRVKYGGFTLIELMITVAIVAILSALAYPAYTQHIVRTKRSAAQSFLYTVANRQEQAMLNARSYFEVATGVPAEWTVVSMTVPKEVSDNYTITVVASTSPAYTVTAAPQPAQLSKDAKCANVFLTHTGTKGITGTGSVSDCWR